VSGPRAGGALTTVAIDRRIGRAVKHLRLKHGIRQVELADFLGMAQSTFSKQERGGIPWTLGRLAKVGRVFSTSVIGLLNLSDEIASRDVKNRPGENTGAAQPEQNKATGRNPGRTTTG
jgi:transcriptional regulator with XRE-family HTH domain